MIPTELIQEIVSHIDAEDVETLARCCLVSRGVLPVARMALYRTVTLHYVPSTALPEAPDALPPPVLSPRSYALEHSLLLNPHLAAIVRGVRLWDDHGRVETAPSSFNHPAHTIRAMWATLPALDKLVVMDASVSFPALATMVQGLVAGAGGAGSDTEPRGKQLRFLSIFEGGMYDYGAPLRDLLRSLPLLERLLVGEIFLDEADDRDRPTFQLTHLVVRSDASKGRFLAFLAGASHASLVSAALPIDASKYDLAPFSRLRTLSLAFRCWNPVRRDKEARKSFKKIVAALATAPASLRRVELVENWQANGISSPHHAPTLARLLEGLPEALDVVHIHGLSLEVSYIVAFLRDAPPSLAWSALELNCRFVDDHGVAKNDEQTLETVRKACSDRGIAVKFAGCAASITTP